VTEFAGQTQVEVTDAADIEPIGGTPDPVTPVTTTSWPDTDAQKEALEGMLYSPAGGFTITNNFASNSFGELGLAVGDKPLIQPTQVATPGSAEAAAVEADNAARAIILDDASSTNFIATGNAAACTPLPSGCLVNGHLTPPYISHDTPFRVGATGTFDDDVILTQGGSPSAPTYRFEPITTVTGPANAAAPASFENTRTAAPDEGQLSAEGTPTVKVASFNVLNYFTTLGDANNDNVGDGGCSAFRDREGDGNNVSSGCDQRGAWDPQDLGRQQEKIVSAINALDADVVGLMEIENSLALGETADEATQTLVEALNAEAGAGTWAANPSSTDLPPAADMDVITNAIIYKPAAVTRLGEARALGDQSEGSTPPAPTDEAFANAREPIAQAFTPTGDGTPFMVVVNHFKSKGSAGPFPGDTDQGDGQGAGNVSRVKQATALAEWVPTVQGEVEDVLLLGDFNSYTQEDPLQVLYSDGYVNLEEESGNEEYSYSFSGLSGSLDHVLANASAVERFTGADVWEINAGEPLPMEYSRFNYHSTDFHLPGPYRSSDHDPVVVGLDLVDEKPAATITAKITPNKVKVDKTRAEVHIRVFGPDGAATGTVVVSVAGQPDQEVELEDGEAQVRLAEFHSPGDQVVTIEYGGDSNTGAATEQVTIQVVG
jgi:5'-nucleotidase